MKGIHNYSDIGKLNRVLMHRIDHEVEGIRPHFFARVFAALDKSVSFEV